MRQARASLPNEALNMEEIKFWLKIMQEHTIFIKLGLPSEAKDYVEATKEFHRAFCSLSQKAERLKSSKKASEVLTELGNVLEEFCHYQRKLLSDKMNGCLGGAHYPFFFDHVIRETMYFLALVKQVETTEVLYKNGSQTKEMVLWLRFMADHTKLMYHYLDPSERRLLKMSMEFVELFDNLVLESRDVASMLYCHKGEIKAFRRFLLDVRIDVQRLRDFKQMTAELISDCRVLSIMSVDLVDHMKRESEHFLMILTLIERGLLKHCPEVFEDDVEPANWEEQERIDDELEIEETDLAEMLEESDDSLNLTGDERMELVSKQQEEDLKAAVDMLSGTALETDNDAEEPLIAVMQIESAENSRVSAVEEEKQVEIVLENQEPVAEIEEKLEKKIEEKLEDTIPVEPILPKEKIYAKASNYKYMPNKFAGKTPEEKLREKTQKEKTQNKIRRLGKK
jgi:hypothetical protein